MPAPLLLELPGESEPRRITLAPAVEPIVVGSDASCGLKLDGPQIEPRHAELFCDGEHWCLRDRNSSHGTYLDNNRLFVTAIRLEVGQQVRLGMGDGAAHFTVLRGAADERDGVDLRREVASFVKVQKRERRKRMRRWAIGLPSAGMVAILSVWGIGALVISQDQADRAAHPERYANERNNEAVERLAAIMAGDARPEDVDMKDIVASASLGRSSNLVDAAIGLVKPGSVLGAPASAAPRARPNQPQRTVYHTPSATAVDENSLATLIDRQRTAEPQKRAALDEEIVAQSHTITLRRLRGLLDERAHMIDIATKRDLSKPEQSRIAEIERRLTTLGIELGKLKWQAGDELASLESQLDPAIVERIRQQVVQAMSTK